MKAQISASERFFRDERKLASQKTYVPVMRAESQSEDRRIAGRQLLNVGRFFLRMRFCRLFFALDHVQFSKRDMD